MAELRLVFGTLVWAGNDGELGRCPLVLGADLTWAPLWAGFACKSQEISLPVVLGKIHQVDVHLSSIIVAGSIQHVQTPVKEQQGTRSKQALCRRLGISRSLSLHSAKDPPCQTRQAIPCTPSKFPSPCSTLCGLVCRQVC